MAFDVWVAPKLAADVFAAYKPATAPSGYSIADHPHLLSGTLHAVFESFRIEVLALDPCATEEFVKERGPLPKDVVEQQTRVESIRRRMEDAVAQHDFAKAREYSEDERPEREKLRSLYRQYGLPDWLYE